MIAAIAMQPAIALEAPFPRERYRLLWKWAHEFPERTMDDFWPKNFDGFAAEMDRRAAGENTWMAIENGTPAGFIGYARLSPHVGTLRGVCFAREVHGTGAAVRALRKVLQMEFDSGVHKINAFPFADNGRAIAFYKKLGAVEEGTLREHTLRGGALADLRVLAFFARKDGYR